MRPSVLSVSSELSEKVLAPIRNAVLAHAGYGVIPVTTAKAALQALRDRHVCAMIIGHSVSLVDRQMICFEGEIRRVPAVVLDHDEQQTLGQSQLHINPLDGPEAFLEALATLMLRDHHTCVAQGRS
jgi:hypothetical protein